MSAILIHCDEDVAGAVWRGLLRLGSDVTSVVEESQFAWQDLAVLRWANENGRVVLTHNVEDFPRIHTEVLSESEHHAGIIIARRALSAGEIIRRVSRICAGLSAEDMQDRLEYLGGW